MRGATPPWSSVVEHALRRAQDACSLVSVQCRRLKLPDHEESRLAIRVWADVQMLMIALRQIVSRAFGNPMLRHRHVREVSN